MPMPKSLTLQIAEAAHANCLRKQPTHVYMTPRSVIELLNENMKLNDDKTILGMKIVVVDKLPVNATNDKFVVCG